MMEMYLMIYILLNRQMEEMLYPFLHVIVALVRLRFKFCLFFCILMSIFTTLRLVFPFPNKLQITSFLLSSFEE